MPERDRKTKEVSFMSEQEAINLFNRATGLTYKESDAKYSSFGRISVANILEVAEMVENMGGVLRARQVIADIVARSRRETDAYDSKYSDY
mgnify:CR=1 FL=1